MRRHECLLLLGIRRRAVVTTFRIEELDAGTAIAVKDTPANPDREDGLRLYVLQQDGGRPEEAKEFLDSGS